MTKIRYHIEPTEAGGYRVTSPDDRGVHVVEATPVTALEIAIKQRADLVSARQSS